MEGGRVLQVLIFKEKLARSGVRAAGIFQGLESTCTLFPRLGKVEEPGHEAHQMEAVGVYFLKMVDGDRAMG
jgi:hypothetical protein